jgi:hypothetical protein
VIVLTGPLKVVNRVALSPDGAYAAAAGGTAKRLVVWATREPDHARHVLRAGFDRRMWNFCFDPSSGLLLTGDNLGVVARDPANAAQVWRVPTRNTWDCGVNGLDVSRDGRELVVSFSDGYRAYAEFQRWELNGRAPPIRKRGARGPEGSISRGVAFLAGTTAFVAADDDCVEARPVGPPRIVVDYRARLRIVNAVGRTTHTLNTEFESVHQLAVSPTGRFVTAQFPQAVLVWDARALDAPPWQLRPQKRFAFTGIAFCPSGEKAR